MKWRRTCLYLVLVVALVILFFNTKNLNDYHRSTTFNRMVNNSEIPLSLSIITFALGPLRALVVDTLWWRAIQQQDKGEYFDALQLADWITKLQPTFASVWVFHGWNISYNIAHDFANEEDRWQWILHAMHLLRDEGLKYNPDNYLIRQELARIFYDRIGSKIDPGAEYFKNQWAFKMMKYLDFGTRDELKKLNSAAASLHELKESTFVHKYSLAAEERGIDVFDFDTNPPLRNGINLNIAKQIQEQASQEIYYYYKRSKIENDLKLDLKRMLKVDQNYGPLDWRLHQAHTIYWAAEDNFEDFMKGGINYAKMIRQSMVESFYEGRLFHNPVKNVISRTNNLQIIGKIHDYVEYLLHNQYSPSVDQLHRDFLQGAIVILYSFNQFPLSHQLFQHYKEDYLQEASVDYEDFIVSGLQKMIIPQQAIGTAGSVVEASIYKSFEWLDLGETDRSNGYLNFAKLMWQRHQKKYKNKPAMLLQPFDKIVRSAKDRFLNSYQIDEGILKAKLKEAQSQKPEDIYIGTFEDEEHDH